MARNPKLSLQSKKHLARLEREKRTSRIVLIGSIIAITLVVLVVGYGILDQTYLSKIRPVAVVNGQKISTKDWQGLVRYTRQRMINQAANIIQNYQLISQIYGTESGYTAYYAAQLQQIEQQLSPTVVGEQVLNQMIDNALLEQEAKKRNITVSDAEIDQKIQEAFQFFPNGTPTTQPTIEPKATSTLSPTQYALVSPTPTTTATPLPTATATQSLSATLQASPTTVIETATATPTESPTEGPTATATAYTKDAFQKDYQNLLKSYQDQIQFSEQELRKIVYNQILYEKMQQAIAEELKLTPEQDMVWARHILVKDETTAKEVLAKLNNGEDWTKLAAEYSIDNSNKDNGGDLGWFYHGMMVKEFEDAAFNLKIGEISQPVKTQYGYHIIQVLGHELRTLSQSEFEQLKANKFQEWLSEIHSKATITIDDTWKNRVPTTPTIPTDLQQAMDEILQLAQQQQQTVPQVQETPQPTP
jgi:hypothetical protein